MKTPKLRPSVRAASLALLAALVGCSAAPERHPDVLVVVVDTLRADRLGAYGSQRGLTPFLDRFASGRAVFSRAYAPSSWTLPSVASLFTSRHASRHGVVGYASPLRPEEETITELVAASGYRGRVLARAQRRSDLVVREVVPVPEHDGCALLRGKPVGQLRELLVGGE